MRNAMLAILALSAATVATVAGSSPAAAYDYPYCLQGRGIGIPGECSYSSYNQCMASASGRTIDRSREYLSDGRTDAQRLFALNGPAVLRHNSQRRDAGAGLTAFRLGVY